MNPNEAAHGEATRYSTGNQYKAKIETPLRIPFL